MRRRTAGSDPPQAARGKLPGNAIRDARNVGRSSFDHPFLADLAGQQPLRALGPKEEDFGAYALRSGFVTGAGLQVVPLGEAMAASARSARPATYRTRMFRRPPSSTGRRDRACASAGPSRCPRSCRPPCNSWSITCCALAAPGHPVLRTAVLATAVSFTNFRRRPMLHPSLRATPTLPGLPPLHEDYGVLILIP